VSNIGNTRTGLLLSESGEGFSMPIHGGGGFVGEVLDCFWALLTVGALMHALLRSSRRAFRAQLPSLLCILALLFPTISLNDDFLQQQLLLAPDSPVLTTLLKMTAASENITPTGRAGYYNLFLLPCGGGILHDQGYVSLTSTSAIGDRSPPPVC
jgi:hypothetical protein